MHRSGSAPASMDGMVQRNTGDVDYDQRSRFNSLGASPSDTFLQDASFDSRCAAHAHICIYVSTERLLKPFRIDLAGRTRLH
jgi:hypothetical protein